MNRVLQSGASSVDTNEQVYSEVLIIGSGIAGLSTALQVSEHKNVLLITKGPLLESNTRYAQGGIAAVISPEDSAAAHREDTLLAGAGLCELEAVNLLVHEGPAGVHELIRWGTAFDTYDGEILLTREGAHSHRRILHAQGDSTGCEIVTALIKQVLDHPRIQVWEEHFTVDLILADGYCKGALVKRPDERIVSVMAADTVLCTGGSGQLYEHTTNPEVATGDGIAMAYRAGAIMRDIEFVQFHPTALYDPGAPCFLISEALRGEGAILRNRQGEAFMARYHPLLELAPRDIVARAIVSEMEREQSPHVYLDITHEPAEQLQQRFPTIYETCMHYGFDLAQDWIPVAPAAHYMMGGIRTDSEGASSIPHLYACGEVSSTGVHGANRLASNSLSEALVYGRRIAEAIGQRRRFESAQLPDHIQSPTVSLAAHRSELQPYCQPAASEHMYLGALDTSSSNRNLTSQQSDHSVRTDSTAISITSAISDVINVNKFTSTAATFSGYPKEYMSEVENIRSQLKQLMMLYAGIRRHADLLNTGIRQLDKLESRFRKCIEFVDICTMSIDVLELRNMILNSRLILTAALYREESRGGHYREDYPARDDLNWKRHTLQHIQHGIMEADNDGI